MPIKSSDYDDIPYPIPKKGKNIGVFGPEELAERIANGEEIPDMVAIEIATRNALARTLKKSRSREENKEKDSLSVIRIKTFKKVVKKILKKHPKWEFREINEKGGPVLLIINTKKNVRRLNLSGAFNYLQPRHSYH